MRRRTYLSLAGGAAAGLAGCVGGTTGATGGVDGDGTAADAEAADGYRVETVATGFDQPWALTHLPDGRLLVTELGGRLNLVDPAAGDVERVSGTPAVFARGQGGLLDVEVGPASPDEPWVHLTYAHGRADGTSTTRLGRGRLDVEGGALEGFEVLHVADPYVDSTGHFGSRIAFADGDCYATVGDRQFKDLGPGHVAQDLGNHLGTVLRLRPDGSIPDDNPFVDDPGARDSIFSYGHRNPQGLAVHPETGAVWETEFGEQDGDEINVIQRGGNYGWPVADEGCTYGAGDPIGVSHDERDDVVDPAYTWECGSGGFPPSGATFYDGDAFPDWRGDLLVGGLASRYLGRFRIDGTDATEADPLLSDRGWRVRDVAVAPGTGHVHVAVDAGDAPIVRLVPA
jgi:quinoprotein glucose dehydrogenase